MAKVEKKYHLELTEEEYNCMRELVDELYDYDYFKEKYPRGMQGLIDVFEEQVVIDGVDIERFPSPEPKQKVEDEQDTPEMAYQRAKQLSEFDFEKYHPLAVFECNPSTDFFVPVNRVGGHGLEGEIIPIILDWDESEYYIRVLTGVGEDDYDDYEDVQVTKNKGKIALFEGFVARPREILDQEQANIDEMLNKNGLT